MVKIDPLTLILLNLAAGAVQGGIGAFGASKEEQDKRKQAQNRRAAINQAVKRLQDPNTLPLIEAASRNLTRALGSVEGSDGTSKARRNELSAEVAARLASTLFGIEQDNQRQINQLLTDEAFNYEDPNNFSLGLDSFLGAILGAGAGATQGAGLAFNSQYLGSEGSRDTVIPPVFNGGSNNNIGYGNIYDSSIDPVATNLILSPFGSSNG